MDDNLKKCPFCGGKARYVYSMPLNYVECTKCKALGATIVDAYEQRDGKKEAVEAWNRRADDGWISVEDRLPDDGKKVLVFHNVKQVRQNRHTLKTIVAETSGVISIGVVTLCNNGEKFQNLWFTYDDYGRGIWIADTGEHVTHWMPLPEPPKEDNQ